MMRRGLSHAVGVGGAAVALAACVLADPPATLPEVVEQPPFILTGSVVPSTSVPVLTTWPTTFVVPVYLIEPADLEWRAAIDYLPIQVDEVPIYAPAGPVSASANSANGVTILGIPIPQPVGLGCSTVTIVAAYGFASSTTLAPDSRGGSSVTWRYAPNGECQTYDASALAAVTFPDAGED